MQVRMQTQLLSPSVQNGYHSHLDSFGFAKSLQGFPSSFKERIINQFWTVNRQCINRFGQSKNHVEVRHWQEFRFSFVNPIFSSVTLTLGAMPIPARIVTDCYVTATIASVDMTAQFCSSAFFDS